MGAQLGSSTTQWSGSLFSYDTMGRVLETWECGPTTCGTSNQASRPLAYTYDLAGNMLTAGQGDGGTVTYTYSEANEVQTISTNITGPTRPGSLVSNVVNSPNGPTSYSLGNGLGDATSYDSMGRLNGNWVCSGGSSPYAPSCSGSTQVYGNAVNWSGVQATAYCDTVLGQCGNFGYDEFNRLTSRSVTKGTAQNFSYGYDRYGNRWSQTVTAGSGTPFSVSFNTATNQISSTGYTYDPAGNLMNDGSHSYTYDAEGNLLQVDGGQTATYVYDAWNRRVRINQGSTSFDLIVNLAGNWTTVWNGTTGAEDRTQFYWGSKPIAWYDSNTHFQHLDWVGTARMQTSYDGAVEGSYGSLPWGDTLTGAGTGSDAYTGGSSLNNAHHYAGLDHDYETDSEHAQFRQYSSIEGRWFSPDPYTGNYDFTNPQSMNRYAYVMNLPTALVDPSGLDTACYLDPSTNNFVCVISIPSLPGGGSVGGSVDAGGTIGPADPLPPPACHGPRIGNCVNAPPVVTSIRPGAPSKSTCIQPNFAQSLAVKLLSGVASATGKTVGYGVGGSLGAGYRNFGFNFGASQQLVVAPDGTAGLATSYTKQLFGVASEGFGGVAGFQLTGSTVQTVMDLQGYSLDGGVVAGDELGVGFDGTVSPGDSLDLGVTGTFGLGFGEYGHAGSVTQTIVHPFC